MKITDTINNLKRQRIEIVLVHKYELPGILIPAGIASQVAGCIQPKLSVKMEK